MSHRTLRRLWVSGIVGIALVAAVLVTGIGGERAVSATAVPGGAAVAKAGNTLYVPAASHVAGSAGTNWRTDVEVHNVGATAATVDVALLRQDEDNTNPQSVSYSVAPGAAARYSDMLGLVFDFTGSGALRISPSADSLVVTSRTYNLLGAGNPAGLPEGSTFGQFVPGGTAAIAIGPGERGHLIQLSHNRAAGSGFRTNIGLVNLEAFAVTVAVDLYDAAGNLLGTVNRTLPARGYTQVNKIYQAVTAGDVADGYAVVRTTGAGGTIFAYASVVDSRTGDPIYIPAQVAAAAAPRPTATPTRPRPTATPTVPDATATPTRTPTTPSATATPTRTPTGPAVNTNLMPYQPSGWDAPLVASGTMGTHVTAGLVGGAPTYIDWAFANAVNEDVTFPEGAAIVTLLVDGVPRVNWRSTSGPFVLEAGFYQPIEDFALEGDYAIPAGIHTLVMEIDRDHRVAESNEDDNTFSISPTWSGHKAAHARSAPIELDIADLPLSRRHDGGRTEPDRPPAATAAKASGSPIYIMAAAHVSGVADTDWRTDVEVVNPGTTMATFTVALLMRDRDNSAPTVAGPFNLAPERAVRYADIMSSMFHVDGAAALRFDVSGGAVLVTSRTYNQLAAGNALGLPAGSTFGQFIGGVSIGDALSSGEEGRLVQLSHSLSVTTGYRTNLGMVNLGASPITLRVELYRADGVRLGTFDQNLRPAEYKQIGNVFARVTSSDVSDGYAVVWTTTDGARFVAYASVVDNRTGDPVCVPATRVRGALAAAGDTMGVPETVDHIVGGLARTANTEPSLEARAAQLQNDGIGALVHDAQLAHPQLVTPFANGFTVDYGAGFVDEDNAILTGPVTITWSNQQVTASHIEGQFAVDAAGFARDGRAPLITNLTGTVDLAVDTAGHVRGDITLSGITPKDLAASLEGSVHFDTALCDKYPVSGGVTITWGEVDYTIDFDGACDGSYGLDSGSDGTPTPTRTGTPTRTPEVPPTATPGTGDLAFRLTWNANPTTDYDLYVTEPSGETIYFSNSSSDTGGRLDRDCTCSSGCTDPIENIFWPSGMAPHGTFEYWVDVWSTCGQQGSRSCRLQVLVNGAVVRTHDLNLNEGESQHFTFQY